MTLLRDWRQSVYAAYHFLLLP